MKVSSVVKILISVFLLLVLPTSCKKEKHAVLKKIDNTAEIKRLTIIADNDYDHNEYLKAYKNYLKIIHLSDPEKNRIDYVDALISIALIQQYEGNYLESENTATKILPHLKYMKKPRFAWETYKVFASNYLATKDYDNALIYAKKAYDLNTTVRRKANALANIALVYMHKKQYKKAVKIYTQLTTTGYYGNKKKTNTLKDFELIDYAVMRNNIGISYANLLHPKALSYYQEALKIRLQLHDKHNLPESYSNLSDYYVDSNLALAKKYAEAAYKHACIINTYQQKKYALETLIRTTTGNDLKKYSNMYVHYLDSINKIQLSQKNQFANIQYYFKKDKQENLELKTQKAEKELQFEIQKNQSYILYVVIFISVFALLFLTLHITLKGKREKDDTIFKSELRISQKLHNELTSEVFKLSTNIQNSNFEKPESKEELLNHLDQIYLKTRKISRENSAILTDENYLENLKMMLSEYSNSSLNIIANGLSSFSWHEIDRIKKITIFRILRELLNEMAKSSNASLISLNFKKETKNIQIIYIDNNTETTDGYVNLKKRLQNVENRIKTIKGTINFEPNLENGLKISFTFPL